MGEIADMSRFRAGCGVYLGREDEDIPCYCKRCEKDNED